MIKTTAKKCMVGVALACALALACTTAAFAVPTAGTSGSQPFSEGKADSTLSVKTDASQLSAEVPLNVTVVANALGGGFDKVPSAAAYKITNKSYFDIVVSDVTATAKSDWHYSDVALSAANKTPTGAIGDINLTLAPSGKSATTVKGSGTSPAAADWKIPAATATSSGELAMTVGGSTSALKKSIGDTTPSDAATISFTIQPAAA